MRVLLRLVRGWLRRVRAVFRSSKGDPEHDRGADEAQRTIYPFW